MTKVQAVSKLIETIMRDSKLNGCIVLIDAQGYPETGIKVEAGSIIIIDTELSMKSIPVIHNLKLELDICAEKANEAFDLLKDNIPDLDKMLQYEELDK